MLSRSPPQPTTTNIVSTQQQIYTARKDILQLCLKEYLAFKISFTEGIESSRDIVVATDYGNIHILQSEGHSIGGKPNWGTKWEVSACDDAYDGDRDILREHLNHKDTYTTSDDAVVIAIAKWVAEQQVLAAIEKAQADCLAKNDPSVGGYWNTLPENSTPTD